jgi:hypothetical protein
MVIARIVLLKKKELFDQYIPPKGVGVIWRKPVEGAQTITDDHIMALFIAPEKTAYPNQRYNISKLEREIKENYCFSVEDLNPPLNLWPDDISDIVLDHEEEVPFDDPRLPQEWKDELDPSRIYEKLILASEIDKLNQMYDELGYEMIIPIEATEITDPETRKKTYLYKILYAMLPDVCTSKNW